MGQRLEENKEQMGVSTSVFLYGMEKREQCLKGTIACPFLVLHSAGSVH